jgi:tetratricopeptide (TPR) repeat protein
MFHESLTTGRDLSPARSLLRDAIPLAQSEPHLLARILIDMTGILWGTDVELAAKRLWPLLRSLPELEEFRGKVLYNVAYSHSSRGQMDQAARYYKKAAPLLKGHHQLWCYHNLAEACAELGRYRAAETAALAAEHLLTTPENRYMHASLQAYLAVLRGYITRALKLIDEALANPGCTPLARAHLGYYQALAYHRMGEHQQATEQLDRTWRYAAELNFLWVCDRLIKLRAELDARKGVS